MKWLILLVCFVAAIAHPTPIRDKIHRVLAYLKQAESNGEWAVNTPNGIYPINEINDKNILDIFNFRPELEQELKSEGGASSPSETDSSAAGSENSASDSTSVAAPVASEPTADSPAPDVVSSAQSGYDAPAEAQQPSVPAATGESAAPSTGAPAYGEEKPAGSDHSAEVPTREEEGHHEAVDTTTGGYGQEAEAPATTELPTVQAAEETTAVSAEEATTTVEAPASTDETPAAETTAIVTAGDGYHDSASEATTVAPTAESAAPSDIPPSAVPETSTLEVVPSSEAAGYAGEETVVNTHETPVTEPVTESPSTETSATEAPSTVAPSTETPSTDAPSTEAPSTEAPSSEAPSSEAPTTEAGPTAPAEQPEPAVDAGYPVAAPASEPEENKPVAPMPVPNSPSSLGYPA